MIRPPDRRSTRTRSRHARTTDRRTRQHTAPTRAPGTRPGPSCVDGHCPNGETTRRNRGRVPTIPPPPNPEVRSDVIHLLPSHHCAPRRCRHPCGLRPHRGSGGHCRPPALAVHPQCRGQWGIALLPLPPGGSGARLEREPLRGRLRPVRREDDRPERHAHQHRRLRRRRRPDPRPGARLDVLQPAGGGRRLERQRLHRRFGFEHDRQGHQRHALDLHVFGELSERPRRRQLRQRLRGRHRSPSGQEVHPGWLGHRHRRYRNRWRTHRWHRHQLHPQEPRRCRRRQFRQRLHRRHGQPPNREGHQRRHALDHRRHRLEWRTHRRSRHQLHPQHPGRRRRRQLRQRLHRRHQQPPDREGHQRRHAVDHRRHRQRRRADGRSWEQFGPELPEGHRCRFEWLRLRG